MVGFIVFIILMAALSNFFAAVEDMGQLISFVLAFTATYRFTKRLIALRKEEKERDYREELKDELRDEIREEMRQGSIQQTKGSIQQQKGYGTPVQQAGGGTAEEEPYYPETSYFHQQ